MLIYWCARVLESNYADLTTRLAALRQIRREADALKLEVGRDVPQRLQQFRERLACLKTEPQMTHQEVPHV